MSGFLRKLHLVLTIGGGFLGAVMTLQIFFTSKESNPVIYALLTAFIVLYSYCVFVGLRFVDHPHERTHLLIFYSLQIPWISSPLIAYRFASGLQISAGLLDFQPTAGFRIGSDWRFSFFQSAPWGLGINFFALVMLIIVMTTKRRAARPPSSPQVITAHPEDASLAADRSQY